VLQLITTKIFTTKKGKTDKKLAKKEGKRQEKFSS
jgi:hypothetical protein